MTQKATDKLLADHRLIRKIMEGFHIDNPRLSAILKTLQRAVVGHAWFEDEIFLPVFKAEPLLERRFVQEMIQEHQDLDHLLRRLSEAKTNQLKELDSLMLQTQVLLSTHFSKEEEGLFPLAERILDSEGLNRIGAEMERRKTEIRSLGQE